MNFKNNIMSKEFRRWNNITGWLVFAISLVVYLMTVEPTVSFWDCGEFILCSFRMEVGHPPGAPLFLMIGRMFALLAGSDTSHVAVWINRFSALASAFTILFLFWSITRLVRLASKSLSNPSGAAAVAVLASGVIGALAYAFCDTFWFSAVEGEVYATSSLFTALVFWVILKWYDEADEPHADRWLIFIAYLMGLSIGVHLLNLLVIPAIVLLYYFRKYKVTTKGTIAALLLSFVLLGILNFIFIPGVAKVAGWFELLFVNVFGMPYNSGLYFYLILFVGLIIFGIWYSQKKGKIFLNYLVTIIAVIMIGYSSFAMIIIRASAHPPMDQNDPSDVFSFIYYINRTQYGETPVVYGPYYTAPVTGYKKSISGYNKIKGRYVPYYETEYVYNKRLMTIFPRMYSIDPAHKEPYEYWGHVNNNHKISLDTRGGTKEVVIPTFGNNLRFFFRYQVGYLYIRYFMWNFVGRQNDIEGNGNVMDGNWISGIPFIDNARLGDQSKLPSDMLTNPARNTYYFLPLIAGLIGLFWQYKRDRKGFWLVMTFFIMTGLAIIVYLNQYPNQPRERDYAYAGSFYAFTIWIGMSAVAVYEFLKEKAGDSLVIAVCPAILLFIATPVLLISQNYNDHDRSNKYTARDIASNYLNSCDKNAILLTYGDNDSFPLWYDQEVEGIRSDIRVANLSYLSSGFYIEEMNRKAYQSDPLPFILPPDKYIEGKRVQLPVENIVKEPYDIKKIVEFAGADDRKAMVDLSGNGDYFNYIPSNKFIVDVDTNLVLENGTVKPYFRNRMISPLIWNFTSETAMKNDLAIMDIVAGNGWKRPFYYAVTVPPSSYTGLENHFVLEGMAYRVSPIKIDKSSTGETGMVDTQTMYDNMMNKFKWGNAEKPRVYLDENNRRIFSVFRRQFGRLSKALAASGENDKAIAAAEKGLKIVPPEKMPYDYYSIDLGEGLLKAGNKEEAEKVFNAIINNSVENLEFISSLPANKSFGLDFHSGVSLQSLYDLYKIANEQGLTDMANKTAALLNKYYGERPGK
jgi:hypothetical protein